MEFFKQHKIYDFMGMRKWWILLSIVLSVGSLISLYFPGPNYGTDFRGGTEIEVIDSPIQGMEGNHEYLLHTLFLRPVP